MKGRSLRHIATTTPRPVPAPAPAPAPDSRPRAPLSRARAALGALGLVSLVAICGACGTDDGPKAEAADLPGATEVSEAQAAVAPTLQITDSTSANDVATTVPAVAETEPSAVTTEATAPPTVVQTLPVPEAPPPARANEPYVELGRIQIPKIGIDTTLLQGISLNTLDLGPGHWPGTALPGGIGNTVIAGHRTSHDKVFRNIDQLVPGDEVIFSTSEGEFVYVVRETTIVKPDAMYIIEQTYEATATLFACHPPGSTRERIVVHLDLSPTQADTSV